MPKSTTKIGVTISDPEVINNIAYCQSVFARMNGIVSPRPATLIGTAMNTLAHIYRRQEAAAKAAAEPAMQEAVGS